MKKRVYKIIDPHVHFFDLEKGKYTWLKSDAAPYWEDKHLIAKNFGPRNLLLNERMELVEFVHIEAGFNNNRPESELAWLHSFSGTHKAIACADLTLPPAKFLANFQACAKYSSFKGLRHILDEDVKTILSHKNTRSNLAAINVASGAKNNADSYIFECQIEADSQTNFDLLHQYIGENPSIKWIINHAGKPDLSCEDFGLYWQQNMSEFAKHENVFVKCSGFEMKDSSYRYQDLVKFIKVLITIFPQEKIMFASNFPLLLFRCSYAEYWQMIIGACEEIGAQADGLIYSNAKVVYGF